MVNAGVKTTQQTMALKNLTIQQQAAKMATAGLTKEQIKENLIKNNNISTDRAQLLAEEAVTSAKIKQTGVTAASVLQDWAENKVTLSNTAADWLEKQSTDALTQAKLQQALQDKILTKQEYLEIAAKYGLLTATESLNLGVKGLTATIKASMASNPVGWILAAISAVVMLVQTIKDAQEEVEQASRDALNAYESAQDTLKSNKQTIEEISDDYAKLSKGVDAFGKNVSLTADEYSRYNDVVNQIAKMFPQMVSGYTEEGNAIISLKGNVDALTQAYEEAASAARRELITDGDAIFKTVKNTNLGSNSQKEAIKLLQSLNDEESIRELARYFNKNINKYGGKNGAVIEIEKILKDAGIEVKFNNLREDWFFTDDDVEYYLKDEIQSKLQSAIKSIYKDFKVNDSVASSKAYSLLDAMLEENYTFTSLPDDVQESIKMISRQFDTEFYQQFKDKDKMFEYILKNLVIPMEDIGTSAELTAAFDLQTKFNNGDVSIKEYEDKVQGIISLIEGLGLENSDSIIKSIRLVFDVDDNGKVDSSAQNVAKNILSDEYDSKVNELTKTDLDIIDRYANAWTLNGKKLLTWDELIAKIEAAKNAADDPSIMDSLSKISKVEGAFDSLGKAIQEFKEDGTVAADTLDGLKETFGDTEGFEELYKVLATGEGDVETAITNVANAYIGRAGMLSDLTDDERQIMIERLKSIGVLNAEEVVMARQKAQEKLNASYQEYSIDLGAYATAEEAKLAIAQQAGLDFSAINDENLQDLIDHYDIDVKKYATAAEQKIAIARAMAKETALAELDPNSDTYESDRAAIESKYSDDASAFTGIQSIVDDYFSKTFSFNFNGQIGIGRDFDDDLTDKKTKEIEEGWEKLINKYENKLALITNERDLIQTEIDRAEAQGGQASKEMYDDLIRSQLEEKQLLEEKKKELEEYLDKYGDSIDPDTWTEYNNAINETAVAIKECTTNIIDFAKSLRDIDMHYFTQAIDEISRLGEEIEFVMSLFEDEDMFDEDGNWTDAGITKINLLKDLMTTYAATANMWQQRLTDLESMEIGENGLYKFDEGTKDAIAEDFKSMLDFGQISQEEYDEYMSQLEDAFAAGGFSKELWTEWHNEAEDGLRDAISANKDAQDQMIEMNDARIDAIEEGINKEIEAYEEYIDVLKESLDAERD